MSSNHKQEKKKRPFIAREVINDVRSRYKYYFSDIKDGFHYKTLAATLFTFFTSLFPAITFGAFMSKKTENSIGVVETLLSTGGSGVIFSILSGQPLVIVGVTGPIAILTSTVYTLCNRWNIPFIPFMSWIGIWGSFLLIIIAILNGCNLTKHVTRFSCEIFGFLVGVLFLESAIKEYIDLWNSNPKEESFLSLIICIATYYFCCTLHNARKWKIFVNIIRMILEDYGAVLSILVFSALTYIPLVSDVNMPTLSVPDSFRTTLEGRSWFIKEIGDLKVGYIFAAFIPAFILIILVFLDHNIAALLATDEDFKLKKPTTFSWDILVISLIMLLCALFGLPYSHGVLPQAPLHTRSLRVKNSVTKEKAVLENRLSNFLQSALIVVSLSFIKVFGYIPSGVLIGFFLYMAYSTLIEGEFSKRLIYIITDPSRRKATKWDKDKVPFKIILLFTIIQFLLTGIIFGVALSPATIAFPVFILLLIPIRKYVLPRAFDNDHLQSLDPVKSKNGNNTEKEDDTEIELA